ncbi:MAG: tRNA (adenosine(37)-N6)-threonylcarbamoyltransferase complex dimerization subunit type 1 TsaB [Lachnospiraceae bacterium]|nr:tRNA (adenosine(37)-N6)-threonylcarbamoyltransferase complex dimerization subunit type 1 TsaB [Lachnospiraceae bacterium]
MLVLGIESSSLVASAAVLSDQKLISEYTVNNALTHSQTLMPMIDAVIRSAGIEAADLDAVAISRGPGSFTGLRIGSATAKGLGLALDKPLVEVPTLEAMAYSLYGITDRIICPIMDARRAEVYSAAFVFGEGGMKTLLAENAGPVEELIKQLDTIIEDSDEKYRGVIFMGDGVPPYKEIIAGNMRSGYSFAPVFLSRQRAASVAALGMEMFREGKCVPAEEHAPVYLRASQAETQGLASGHGG